MTFYLLYLQNDLPNLIEKAKLIIDDVKLLESTKDTIIKIKKYQENPPRTLADKAFGLKTPIFGALIIMIISAALAGQYFSVYEKNNLEKLYGVLPLRKSEVVIGRYRYALCILVINGIIAAILAYIISFLTNRAMSNLGMIAAMGI